MIVRLFCPRCAYEVAQKQQPEGQIEVPVPVTKLVEDGRYEVRCDSGHVSEVILDNLKFELLFELGLNALLDGYPREAVSSFVSSLERFQEFYWRVVMAHFSVPAAQIESAWKPLAKMSERQLGAYVTASLLLTKSPPPLLNPNKEAPFRNSVIHQGVVPKPEEAIEFGNSIMTLINGPLGELRSLAPGALLATYEKLSPRGQSSDLAEGEDEMSGAVNILTAIDVRYPPKSVDPRAGSVREQLTRIAAERTPKRMRIFTPEEFERQFPNREVT